MMYPAKHLSISISRSPDDVYQFISNPENLPKWASGLNQSKLEKEGDFRVTESPMGKVKVKFCEKNKFGVVDLIERDLKQLKSILEASGSLGLKVE